MTIDGAARVEIVSPAMWGDELSIFDTGTGTCREIVGSRPGRSLRSLYSIRLGVLSSTVRLRHGDEAVYYVSEGAAEVASSISPTTVVSEGGFFHIHAGIEYQISATAGAALIGGPSPFDTNFGETAGPSVHGAASEVRAGCPSNAGVSFYHRDEPGLMVPMISSDARFIVWYGSGAVSANMNYVVLKPGERNKEHVHRYSEDTIFILEGRGTAEDLTNGRRLAFGSNDTVTIPPGVVHAIAADRGERVISVGGPCPADLDMLRRVGVDVDAIAARLVRR